MSHTKNDPCDFSMKSLSFRFWNSHFLPTKNPHTKKLLGVKTLISFPPPQKKKTSTQQKTDPTETPKIFVVFSGSSSSIFVGFSVGFGRFGRFTCCDNSRSKNDLADSKSLEEPFGLSRWSFPRKFRPWIWIHGKSWSG